MVIFVISDTYYRIHCSLLLPTTNHNLISIHVQTFDSLVKKIIFIIPFTNVT
ncbi:Uncharacterised protein [Segatella copri]|nr:Uncharacterised protein [Segatella copri]